MDKLFSILMNVDLKNLFLASYMHKPLGWNQNETQIFISFRRDVAHRRIVFKKDKDRVHYVLVSAYTYW